VVPEEGERDAWTATDTSEAAFSDLGRRQPAVMARLLKVAAHDSAAWTLFQSRAQDLALKRNRCSGVVETLRGSVTAAKGREADAARLQQQQQQQGEEEEEAEEAAVRALQGRGCAKVVLISGFESFNVKLYRDAAKTLRKRVPGLQLIVFSDRDLATNRVRVRRGVGFHRCVSTAHCSEGGGGGGRWPRRR
jgi:magnesium chelatase subunit H